MGEDFSSIMEDYDEFMKIGCPRYHYFLRLLAGHVEGRNILDLGIGTGNLETYIFERNPEAHVTGIDTDPKMLETAGEKHAGYGIELLTKDLLAFDYGQRDAIVTSMTLHHFTNEEKRAVFRKIYGALPSGGIFLNFDMVPAKEGDEIFLYEFWRENGMPLDIIRQEKIDMRKRDKPSPLPTQRDWLRVLGFSFKEIETYHQFALYKAVKK